MVSIIRTLNALLGPRLGLVEGVNVILGRGTGRRVAIIGFSLRRAGAAGSGRMLGNCRL